MTLSRTAISAVLDRHGLSTRRSLGQNFVVDPDTVRRIVACAGVRPGDAVVEVGPGAGSLTLALVEAGARVLAIEKDSTMLAVLEEVLEGADPAPVVLEGDATALDWPSLLGSALIRPAGDRGWSMVANLPYNVAVPIVIHALRNAPTIESMVVMVQEEVAARLAAVPGGRTIGVPTIKVGWYATVERVMAVPREVFLPVPRVDSAVVRITRHQPPGDERTADVAFGLVEKAYRQRRKMLRSSLGAVLGEQELQRAGILPTARPEELDASDWARAARVAGEARR
jgi:16S rRNA (adenine1518-N6/adenine1519-N6)-dimethyltransferase